MTSVSQKVLMFDLVRNKLMNAFSGSKFFIWQFSGLIFRQLASDMTHSLDIHFDFFLDELYVLFEEPAVSLPVVSRLFEERMVPSQLV